MEKWEKKHENEEVTRAFQLNDGKIASYSKALLAEIDDIRNRKFREYLLDLKKRGDTFREDREIVLSELSKKNKMFRLFRTDELIMILASEQGNDERFIKYLYEKTDLTIIQIATIINQGIIYLDRLIQARGWIKDKRPQYTDFPLLRALIISGAKNEVLTGNKEMTSEEIRAPFVEIFDRIRAEILLRITRTSHINTAEVRNLETLTNTAGKLLAFTLEAHGDMPIATKVKLQQSQRIVELKEKELDMAQMGGIVTMVESFESLTELSKEEILMMVKDRMKPLIDGKRSDEFEEMFTNIAMEVSEITNDESEVILIEQSNANGEIDG